MRQPLQSRRRPWRLYSTQRHDDGMWSNGRRIHAQNRKNASRRALGSGRHTARVRQVRTHCFKTTQQSLCESIVDHPRTGLVAYISTHRCVTVLAQWLATVAYLIVAAAVAGSRPHSNSFGRVFLRANRARRRCEQRTPYPPSASHLLYICYYEHLTDLCHIAALIHMQLNCSSFLFHSHSQLTNNSLATRLN